MTAHVVCIAMRDADYLGGQVRSSLGFEEEADAAGPGRVCALR